MTMNNDIYEIEKISRGELDIYKIYEKYMASMYLVCGKERACLIDTAYGLTNLKEVTASLTNLPVFVINTHGHLDHVMGNRFFNECYLNPADKELYLEVAKEFPRLIENPYVKETYGEYIAQDNPPHLTFPSTGDISDGDIIDLGGKKLYVYEIPGHTGGSIMLIDKDEKICFAGDSIIEHCWLFLNESLSAETYRESLNRALKILKEECIERIYNGHYAWKPLKISDAEEIVSGLNKIVEGKIEGEYFANEGGEGYEYKFGEFSILCK